MKTLFWIVKLLLFFVAITFAMKNTDATTVRYYMGLQWQAPLIVVILLVFGLGAIAGVLASLAHIMRLRGEIDGLRKTVTDTHNAFDAIPSTRISDVV
jgi:lipopolysaccharide assembly protein A